MLQPANATTSKHYILARLARPDSCRLLGTGVLAVALQEQEDADESSNQPGMIRALMVPNGSVKVRSVRCWTCGLEKKHCELEKKRMQSYIVAHCLLRPNALALDGRVRDFC